MTLGEKIHQLRKAGGLSQEQLAEMIGVSRQSISKWETDQSSPEIENLLALSKVFSLSTDELLGKEFGEGVESAAPQLKEVVDANMKKRKLTLGWATTIFGLLLLLVDFFALKHMQYLEREMYGHWNNRIMHYAAEQPMPIVFFITAVIILLGALLLLSTLVDKNKAAKKL